jgi:nucleoside-diphosphate-sugar epimerase
MILLTAMSFDPEIIFHAIKKYYPDFKMDYDVDQLKQGIANSWPNKMDDTAAREEWGWNPVWDLDRMTQDMLKVIKEKHEKGLI